MSKLKYYLLLSFLLFIPKINAYNPPTMGWSSWNTYRVNISDSLIRVQADALKRTGLAKAGYNYVNIDDGFFGGRDEKGRLITHPTRFPNGFHNLVNYIHNAGLKAGIYSEAGKNTCGSIYDNDAAGIGVGLFDHDSIDVDRFFNDWDFDFIKIDYCSGLRQKLNEQERYTQIVNTIKEYASKDVRLNICRWAFPGTWVSTLADSWRTTSDINASWNSVKYIIAKNLYLSPYASKGHFNDMDMLEIGRGLSKEEEKTHFGMWCMMSSPLLIGCDITKIPEQSLQLLLNKDLIAINQDPLALQAHVAYRSNDCYVLTKDLKKGHGQKRAVALYNPSNEKKACLLDLSKLEYQEDKIKVKDVFTGTEKTFQGQIYIEIPAHGTAIYILKGKRRALPSHYEAEQAWLKKYQDIWNDTNIVRCAQNETASGGIIVKYIGNDANNYMEWRHVYAPKNHKYKLTIHYFTPNERSFSLRINGEEEQTFEVSAPAINKSGKVVTNITLKKGYNTIRLFNKHSWAPNIDFIEIEAE